MNEIAASPIDPDADCICPPPWNNDHTPNPNCVQHGENMEDEEATA
jgi:hypothetical protein